MMWDIGGKSKPVSKKNSSSRTPQPPPRKVTIPVPPSEATYMTGSYFYPSAPASTSVNSYTDPSTPWHAPSTKPFPPPQQSGPTEVHHHSSSKNEHHHRRPSDYYGHLQSQPSPHTPIVIVTSKSSNSDSDTTQAPIILIPSERKSKKYIHKPFTPQIMPPTVTESLPVQPLNPDLQHPKRTGHRRALCIGINYRGQKNELNGCINDARHVRDFLTRNKYRSNEIMMLRDDTNDPRMLPTRKNILEAMQWLVQDAKPEDSLFFHYSGHGGQTRDLDGDKVNGWDEVIYPLDFKKNGHIADDLMHKIMVRPLPPGCRLMALFDVTCHSGSGLDLPYVYSSHGRLKSSPITGQALTRKATAGEVISWSACQDGQTRTDTFAGGVAIGAMSYAFISALDANPMQTYRELFRSIRVILNPRYSQKPRLGSSHQIDTNAPFIL